MPRLPAGRQGRGASLPASQLVILFEHDGQVFRLNRFPRLSQDFSEEPTGKFVFFLRETFPMIEGPRQMNDA